ncbi:hypothetical protein F2P81_018815 [Scophthalmus maximus]|uniref:Uncharacterized protein n=1 Tax=Scophthalmus maximus TaxID=52904 RepID=A0A6A4SD55_SCOMX|nr:hypothetical protein F2P81_018815 [Scophthalmus maximus]
MELCGTSTKTKHKGTSCSFNEETSSVAFTSVAQLQCERLLASSFAARKRITTHNHRVVLTMPRPSAECRPGNARAAEVSAVFNSRKEAGRWCRIAQQESAAAVTSVLKPPCVT